MKHGQHLNLYMPRRFSSQALALSLAVIPLASNADTVFKCKDHRGSLLYQGSKCDQAEEVGKWDVNANTPLPPKPESVAYYVSAKKGTGGVYRLDGEINGVAVNMVVDTGAAFLSIPSQMADQLKLSKGDPHSLMSANGMVQGYNTTVKNLKIGKFLISNISAVVSPNTAGILLGQSVLGSLKVEQSKEELRLSVPQ